MIDDVAIAIIGDVGVAIIGDVAIVIIGDVDIADLQNSVAAASALDIERREVVLMKDEKTNVADLESEEVE